MPRKHSVIDRLGKNIQESADSQPKKKPDYWGFLLIGILLGGMLLGLFLEARSVWLRSQLPKHGVQTVGTVIEHQHINRYGGDYFFITSEYDAIDSSGKAQNFIQEHSGTEEQYKIFVDGSPIPIIYLPQNPKTSDISGNETELINDKWEYENTRRAFVFMGGTNADYGSNAISQRVFLIKKKRRRLNQSNQRKL